MKNEAVYLSLDSLRQVVFWKKKILAPLKYKSNLISTWCTDANGCISPVIRDLLAQTLFDLKRTSTSTLNSTNQRALKFKCQKANLIGLWWSKINILSISITKLGSLFWWSIFVWNFLFIVLYDHNVETHDTSFELYNALIASRVSEAGVSWIWIKSFHKVDAYNESCC